MLLPQPSLGWWRCQSSPGTGNKILPWLQSGGPWDGRTELLQKNSRNSAGNCQKWYFGVMKPAGLFLRFWGIVCLDSGIFIATFFPPSSQCCIFNSFLATNSQHIFFFGTSKFSRREFPKFRRRELPIQYERTPNSAGQNSQNSAGENSQFSRRKFPIQQNRISNSREENSQFSRENSQNSAGKNSQFSRTEFPKFNRRELPVQQEKIPNSVGENSQNSAGENSQSSRREIQIHQERIPNPAGFHGAQDQVHFSFFAFFFYFIF